MITFADGYRDNFFKPSPVLARLGMRATAYVVSSRISAEDPSFALRRLRVLDTTGWSPSR